MTPKLLDRIDEIDAPWTESVLHASGHDGARVSGVSATPVGAGNVSDTVRLDIDYAQSGSAPASVVAKFRPSDEAIHQHGLGSGAYHREIGAYRAITEHAACRIPELFWVAGDETNINLVVEDLTTSATAGDQVAGVGFEDARAVITELARLHATFAPVVAADPPAWPIAMADAADYWSDATRRGADAALARYRGRISDDDLALVDTAGDAARTWYELEQSRLSLSHGDPRVDNVLFEQHDGATRAVLIDWQVTGLRNPMYDVGYFLSGSVSVEERRERERELIDHYLEVYAERASGYALDDYRTQLLSGLMVTTAAIAVLPDNDVVNTLICALLERNCAAAGDWDSFSAFL